MDTVRDAHHLLANLGMLSLSRGYGPVVRAPRDREVVHVPVGTAITARMPTLEEMTQWSLEPGVPMLVAGDKAWPADRYEFVAGPTHQPPNPDT